MSSKLSYVLEVKMSDLLANFDKLEEKINSVLSKIRDPLKVDVDASGAEEGVEDAKSSIDSVEDKNSILSADGEDAIAESEETKSEIAKVPERKNTKFTDDNSNMLASITGITVALGGFIMAYNRVNLRLVNFYLYLMYKRQLKML